MLQSQSIPLLLACCWLLHMYGAESVAQTRQPDPEQVLQTAFEEGDPHRGVLVFGSPKFACVSCHQVGRHGGQVGPNLSKIGLERKPEEIVESLLTPRKTVKPEYSAVVVVTEDGRQIRGYPVGEAGDTLTLKDPSSEELFRIPTDQIAARKEIGTLMPEGLAAAMTSRQRADVIRFLLDLGHAGRMNMANVDAILEHAVSHVHGPATFEYSRHPLHPEHWPSWQHEVNRDRIYDFYTKQAEHFRTLDSPPPLLSAFPGLDGGTLGHWGNQNEATWADGRWNDTDLGSLQSGVFRGAGQQIPRGICVRVSDRYAVCFDPDTLSYPVAWQDGFVRFSDVRHGFMHGLQMQGKALEFDGSPLASSQPSDYLGLYRDGRHVVFHYRVAGTEFLDTVLLEGETIRRIVAPADEHPLAHVVQGGRSQWPQQMTTDIELHEDDPSPLPYVVDHIAPPFENPWNALMFFGGHAFLPDGSALLCTMQGDVWHVKDFGYPSRQATWRRFASGLHQALGIVVDGDGIYVLGRDQITRLHDLNNDGEADYYESFCNAYETSPAGHDYICGLQRDRDGYFYTASGNQGLLKISPDGQHVEVLATGFRNPDGLGLSADGIVTVPCSEGSWTPASTICAVPTHGSLPAPLDGIGGHRPPFFGLGGPRNGIAPDLPLVYLPRGIDNSSGGQTVIDSDQWGPLQDQMLHFSFGTGSHCLLLRDEVGSQMQGAIVPLPGEFRSGAHRGRFHPLDGQLYVTGMAGWGSYTPDDGCFDRVRYTGAAVQVPTAFHVHRNGILLSMSSPIDKQVAENVASHFAQAWNYRYSPGYGSAEFSTRHYGTPGHDVFPITRARVLDDQHSLFLEIPDLQPVSQLHLRLHTNPSAAVGMFLTVHALDEPFVSIPEISIVDKEVAPHPILRDVAYADKVQPNRWTRRIEGAREIVLETGTNLSFQTPQIKVRAGEPIRLILKNPDVVPHNWALIRPGTLMQVGDLANRLIADPDAFIRHYIPETPDVIVHTDVVQPNSEFIIDFHAPQAPGTYPFLCTFPGHWLVMNGQMIVE